MHKHRFYIPQQNTASQILTVSLPEYHHIIDVLRCKEGDPVVFFDGKGTEYTGKILSIDSKSKSLTVNIEKTFKEKSARPLILVQSLIKAGYMDVIIKQATELGVTDIYPLSAKNSVVKLEPKQELAKIGKWQRITEEACKQCGRSILPYIDKIWSFKEALDSLDWVDTKIICTPSDTGKSLRDLYDKDKGSVAVMIGPEGDFTDSELSLACSRGWAPVCFGKTVLRAETAAVSILGVLCYKFGYWN